MSTPEMLIAIVLVFTSISLTESSADGWTDPSGPIIQQKGSDIRISCGVNGYKYSSSGLGFYNNTNNEFIDKKFVRVVNSSVIEMFLPNATEQESVIVCKLNRMHGISYNDVKIGRPPADITGLKCLSDNWQKMNCTFEKPYNPVAVQYSMKYRIVGSSQIIACRSPAVMDPKIFWCEITSNAYRRANPMFVFRLTGTNAFGTNEQEIPIDNHASVIPAPPEDFNELKIMSDSVVLQWHVNSNIVVFPKPFDYEFSITSPAECEKVPQRLRFTNLPSMDEKDSPTNFTQVINLKFAHTWYDISIRMRISSPNDNEEMWSKWVKRQVKTTMRRPDHPPAVDVGSFSIGLNGDVYVYWKHLQKCYQNGANYSYIITSSDKKLDTPNEIITFRAQYVKDRVNLLKDTTFAIKNVNSAGESLQASVLVLPGLERRLDGPSKIKKVLQNSVYKLSWSPPEHQTELITSYTVFWCVAKSELPNSCEPTSYIDFVRRPPTETFFEFESNGVETINFAVSANSQRSTSGMIWALCTTADSSQIGKIKTIWIPRLASTEIEVEWKLECTDSGIVAGYQLEYCPIEQPKTMECIEPEKKLNITRGLDNPKHTLTGLKPYTTYKIIIRMFSNSTMGPASDPLANTTLEAAPSEVRGLIARNIGNTSVELYWDPPEFSNGVLLFYKVWANGKISKVSEQENTVEIDNGQVTRMNYTLKDLVAYEEYDIAVEACTNKCSEPTKTKIKTTIGAPGNFTRQPSIETYRNSLLKNHTSATITWEEPKFKGGELDYYEFKTKYQSNDGNVIERIVKTRKRDCFIEELCADSAMFYEFSVRAVNFVLTPHAKEAEVRIEGSNDRQSCDKDDPVLLRSLVALRQADPHGWFLPGPYSQAIGHSCNFGGFDSKQSVMMMFLIIASLVIIVMVFYSYRKIKDMKDILVQMPPGLEDLAGDKSKKGKDLGNMDKMAPPDILRNVDNTSINCEDENGQLLKKSLNGSLNEADCSSSMHSDSTRSEMDQMDNEAEIEYDEFGNDDVKRASNDLQSFMIEPSTEKEISQNMMSPDVMPTSTPIADKSPKPYILNPKAPMPSNGYVIQPVPKVISPASPINSNGYVTHSMFNPMQSSGYTPLSAFGKPIMNQNSPIEDKITPKMAIVASTDQEGISGYVTHKQLSDFGHNNRMQ